MRVKLSQEHPFPIFFWGGCRPVPYIRSDGLPILPGSAAGAAALKYDYMDLYTDMYNILPTGFVRCVANFSKTGCVGFAASLGASSGGNPKPRDPGSKGTDWSRNSQPMEWVEQILSTS